MCCDCIDDCISGLCSSCVSDGSHHIQSSGQQWRHWESIVEDSTVGEKKNTAKESQIASMQNLVQTSTLVQNSLCQDLDRLRTVNLYEGCIQETRTCLLLSLSNDWIASNTGFLLIHQSWSKHINIGTHKLCMTVQLITISIPYRTQSTSHPAYCVICPVPTTLWQPRTTRMETLFAANVKLLLLLVLVTTHSLPAMPSAH